MANDDKRAYMDAEFLEKEKALEMQLQSNPDNQKFVLRHIATYTFLHFYFFIFFIVVI